MKDGCLEVRLTMQVKVKSPQTDSLMPQCVIAIKDYVKMFETESKADVVFEFDDGSKLMAHSQILYARADLLWHLVDSRSNDDEPIPITGVDPKIFRQLLVYVYSNQIMDLEDSLLKDTLKASDQHECFGLKRTAVIRLTELLTPDNTIDMLILADQYHCPLLREEAMWRLLGHAKRIQKTAHWKKLKDSPALYDEMVRCMVSGLKDEESAADVYKELQKLQILDKVDGTKGMLQDIVSDLAGKVEEESSSSDVDEEENRSKSKSRSFYSFSSVLLCHKYSGVQ